MSLDGPRPTDELIIDTVLRHKGNQTSAAAELGLPRRSVSRRVQARPDLLPPRSCFGCGAEQRPLLRFSISRTVRVEGRRTKDVVGGVDLCERCWMQVRNTTPRRRRRRIPIDGATTEGVALRQPHNDRPVLS